MIGTGNRCLLYLKNTFFYDKIVLQENIRKGIYMKKIMNKINFAIIGMMVASPAFAAVNESGICEILGELKKVFNLLRTFAFIGAAFMIAGWAWGFISAGKIDAAKEAKDKGMALLIGFALLFGVGIILQFLGSTSGANALGCGAQLYRW